MATFDFEHEPTAGSGGPVGARLNAAQRPGKGRSPVASRNALRWPLLMGVCSAAVIVAWPAMAADFTAGSEAEFGDAIAAANASSDPSSTITLTGSFPITAAPATISKTVTIDTGANTLTLDPGGPFTVEDAATLTISGNVLGTSALSGLGKDGSGALVMDGAVASGVAQIGIRGGTVLVEGGSTIDFETTGTHGAQLAIAQDAGETATLTISGTGTVVTSAGTDTVDMGNTTGEATLDVTDGGVLDVRTSTALRSSGTSFIKVSGAGSEILANDLAQLNGTTSLNVTAGGLISTTSATTLGGANFTSQGTVNGVVSGAGSKLEVGTTLFMQQGTLSVLGGGVVTANAISEASANRGAAPATPPDFDVLVSGEGSKITSATTFILGTTGTGTLTIADGGTVAVDGGVLTMGGVNAASRAVLNIGGAVGKAAEGAGTLDAGSITLATSAQINFNHTDNGYVFAPAINGGGSINQIAGHTIFDADQLSFTGLTTIKGGILEVDGSLGGTVDVTGGTLSGIGTVGNTALEAAGTISPGGDSIGTLTIGGDYTGNGGTLQMQTVLGDDGSSTDRLVVTGDTGGATNLRVTNAGGAGAPTTNGIEVVDVGGSSAGSFALQGDYTYDGDQAVVGGAYAYRLYQGGDGNWYLRSSLIPTPPPSGPTAPLYQPGVPIYESYANVLQDFNALPTLQQRVGNRSWMGASDGEIEGSGMWGRLETSHTSVGGGTSTTGADRTDSIWRLQGGVDTLLSSTAEGQLIGSVWGQIGTIDATVDSPYGVGTIGSTAAGVGGALTWYGRSGFYLDGQGQVTGYDSSLGSTTAGRTLAGGNLAVGLGLSVEAGQRLGLGGGWSLTPQAQLSYSGVDFADFTDSFGTAVTSGGDNSLTGRLGLSADFERPGKDRDGKAGRTHIYGIANLYYDFGGGAVTDVAGTGFANRSDPLRGGVGFGGTYNWDAGKYALHGEVSVNTSLEHFGQSSSVAGTGGLRVAW